MMGRLIKRGEEISRRAQQQKIGQVVARLQELLGARAVELEGTNVTVSGQDLVRKWLADSRLRFMGSELK